MSDKPHRETIFLEDAEVLRQEAFPAEQFVIEVRAPECASRTSISPLTIIVDSSVEIATPLRPMTTRHASKGPISRTT